MRMDGSTIVSLGSLKLFSISFMQSYSNKQNYIASQFSHSFPLWSEVLFPLLSWYYITSHAHRLWIIPLGECSRSLFLLLPEILMGELVFIPIWIQGSDVITQLATRLSFLHKKLQCLWAGAIRLRAFNSPSWWSVCIWFLFDVHNGHECWTLGASGTGRTTFVNTLCDTNLIPHKVCDSPETAHQEESIKIRPVDVGGSHHDNPRYPLNIHGACVTQSLKRMVYVLLSQW